MNKNADKGHNNITEPRQFCNTRSHRAVSHLGGIDQGPFENSLSQTHLCSKFFEVPGVTQGINLAIHLHTLAEIWLKILLVVLEVYQFSVVSSEELPGNPLCSHCGQPLSSPPSVPICFLIAMWTAEQCLLLFVVGFFFLNHCILRKYLPFFFFFFWLFAYNCIW